MTIDSDQPTCPECDFDLTGVEPSRGTLICPECGTRYAEGDVKSMGGLTASWRTELRSTVLWSAVSLVSFALALTPVLGLFSGGVLGALRPMLFFAGVISAIIAFATLHMAGEAVRDLDDRGAGRRARYQWTRRASATINGIVIAGLLIVLCFALLSVLAVGVMLTAWIMDAIKTWTP